MTQDILLALIGFSFACSITPGPNNLMLMASGANYGIRRTLPHLAGVALGFVILTLMIGAGLERVFDTLPGARGALKLASGLYMLWLAWKIATAAPPDAAGPQGKPMTFAAALAFQWVNPKAWAMALTALAVYAPGEGLGPVLLVAAVFGAVNLPSVAVWVLMGREMRRLLTSPARLTLFNRTMALLLVLSLWPILAA